MNGRVYDPGLGRFLSVDPVFQFPTNTQSLNPYTYVLNSPLTMTDPTGLCGEDGDAEPCETTSGGKKTTTNDEKKGGKEDRKLNKTQSDPRSSHFARANGKFNQTSITRKGDIETRNLASGNANWQKTGYKVAPDQIASVAQRYGNNEPSLQQSAGNPATSGGVLSTNGLAEVEKAINRAIAPTYRALQEQKKGAGAQETWEPKDLFNNPFEVVNEYFVSPVTGQVNREVLGQRMDDGTLRVFAPARYDAGLLVEAVSKTLLHEFRHGTEVNLGLKQQWIDGGRIQQGRDKPHEKDAYEFEDKAWDACTSAHRC